MPKVNTPRQMIIFKANAKKTKHFLSMNEWNGFKKFANWVIYSTEAMPQMCLRMTLCTAWAILITRCLPSVRSSFVVTIYLINFSSLPTGSNLIKLGSHDPGMKLHRNCSKSFVPCRTLVTMATESRQKLKSSLKEVALRFGMIYNLEVLFKECSNYSMLNFCTNLVVKVFH